MCYSVCWETVEGELCLGEVPEAMRCVLLCMMEAVEGCAHFRGFRNFHCGSFLVTVRHQLRRVMITIIFERWQHRCKVEKKNFSPAHAWTSIWYGTHSAMRSWSSFEGYDVKLEKLFPAHVTKELNVAYSFPF